MSLNLRQAIRARTGKLHGELDSHPALAPLSLDAPSPDDVMTALLGLGSAYHGVELVMGSAPEDLAELTQPVPGWSRAIGLDIALLNGVAAHPRAPQFFRTMPSMPSNTAEWLGHLYVALGSSLGSSVIARKMAQHPLRAMRDLHFFRVNATFAARFSVLIGRLERLPQDEATLDRLVVGADGAFKMFLSASDKAYAERVPDVALQTAVGV
jgi:heme oxygenase